MGLAVVWYRNGSVKATSNHSEEAGYSFVCPKRFLAVYLQSYQLALAEKERLATASDFFGNYDSTQSAMPIPATWKAEPVWQNI